MNFKLIQTASLLIIALIVIPLVFAYFDFGFILDASQMDTLKLLLKIMLALAILCFIIGELAHNNSQVDKLWSIVPAIYVWIVAYHSGFMARPVLMAVLVTIWALRLTYNFSRRGAYTWRFWSGEEDYRWAVLRKMPIFKSKIAWKAFHLFFICLYQMSLILLFTLPILVSCKVNDVPIGLFDVILAVIFIGFVAFETIADQQQWNYQTEKHRRKADNLPLESYSKGFVDTGLWARMRHPNYFAEQAIWFTFYLFSVISTGRFINWSIAGVVLLLLLFRGSSDFSEKISAEKYPDYKDYIKKVPRFLPKLF